LLYRGAHPGVGEGWSCRRCCVRSPVCRGRWRAATCCRRACTGCTGVSSASRAGPHRVHGCVHTV